MIVAEDVHLTLGRQPVLQGVSLTVEPGRVVALCGPNGAGKSTLLACLAGEHPDCSHAIRYFGVPVAGIAPQIQARHRVVLEQSPLLSAEFTLSELIELGVPLEIASDTLVTFKAEAIAALGFNGREHQFVSSLSGGQKHRAHMARVLTLLRANRHLGHDCFLFLDEPTASLDIKHQILILKMVKDLAEGGVGVLVVLHDLNLAAAFADHVILLQEGRIAQAGAPQDVFTTDTLSQVYDTEIFVDRTDTGQVVIQPMLEAS
ncbi:MAG: ATP-binding cassette domain-containing protein [Pseudomonadota bacterium]